MIEIQCPACGAAGRAPADKVNSRLICRKCLKAFHVTASGRTVLGDPPDPGAAHTPTHELHAPDETEKVDQWFEKVGRALVSPTSAMIALALAAVIGLVAYRALQKPPETLEERAARVARAAVHGDLRTIHDASIPGTDSEATRWYDSVRSQCDDFRQRLGSGQFRVEVGVRQREEPAGTAETVANIQPEETIERKGNALPDPTLTLAPSAGNWLSLPMAWKAEGSAGWKLDPRKTLDLAGPPL
ncbi:hypothetical protein OJF2_15530 [Aquisphaera giovannonii]|uniref:Uncharacterized protein n=1 Tax=Aquisphaera giovannonii TaxID=406548 RepID=A0A5B9VYI6_9BACT|nr:hypothetical protein [Aquisphaera giovannonii]QEH33057.1 hypothetical protein OJF2_15530 [Aquisphaera giovannonii]